MFSWRHCLQHKSGSVLVYEQVNIANKTRNQVINFPFSGRISGKPEVPQQLVGVCKFEDHNKLAEETANAVIDRLLPLLSQEHEVCNFHVFHVVTFSFSFFFVLI